jgi:hypothetical protein
LPIFTKRCFLDPGDFFTETIFVTLVSCMLDWVSCILELVQLFDYRSDLAHKSVVVFVYVPVMVRVHNQKHWLEYTTKNIGS